MQIEQDVLSKNNHLAAHNREHFSAQHILVLNLVSSPRLGQNDLANGHAGTIGGQITLRGD
ncbi:Hydrogenase isoenzymes nickel incorporation protein hypB [Serratia fonticola]|uniref:Hydrogenase isoenzymes nickel incorporation protein hypB n=1 Tax=Serratia fonticola TaxID=47917 RepID=A0A4U9THM5_SERFO|nr:Hydrogenase isoenzymes nickel incorporation protein hypB [Serratia fonticola]